MEISNCVYLFLFILTLTPSKVISDNKEQRNSYLKMMEVLVANAEKTKKIAAMDRVEISDSDFNQIVDIDGTVFWGGQEGRQLSGRRGVCQTNSQSTPVCCPGFKELITGANLKCEPACPLGCLDGLCIEPGLCQCPADRIFIREEGRCVGRCPQSCFNGRCVAQVFCHCRTGYVLHSSGEYCLLSNKPK